VKLDELRFERPAALFASAPPELRGGARDGVRLLVSGPEGHEHHAFRELPDLLAPGDLLVVNESATLPASLAVESRLGPVRLSFSTRFGPGLWLAEPRWSPAKQGPLPVQPGEVLRAGDAAIHLLAPYPGIPRLWFAQSDAPVGPLLAARGEPIHYAYAPAYPMDAYQTLFSRVPGSAEMPSAARPFTPRVRETLDTAGVRIAPIVLHTGVSSLEIEESVVERQALYPEPFRVPAATARLVNETRARGGRVVAVGTTVVRALESAWGRDGVRPASGFTRQYVNEATGVHAIDGLLTGLHDPVTSHLAMLSAVAGIARVKDAYAEAVARKYMWHEFGDSHLLWSDRAAS
jgi:S-adenosylmethionine:tRNA ribosyltransferase-isomerase